MTDDTLRDAYARAIEARGTFARAACARPEALLALVQRDGTEAERLATLDHAMACPACREEFELLRSIEHAGGEGIHDAVGRIRWQRYATIALAASAVLAVGLGPGRQMWDRETMRGGENDITTVEPARDAVVDGARQPVTFTWRAVPGARRYTLELLTGDGAVAVTRQTADTTLVVAPPPTLAPGEYLWWVRALGDDGSERRSGTVRLRVKE